MTWRHPDEAADRRVMVAIALLVAILASGAAGFVLVEGYSWAEAVYMAVITVTTVGFGELRPLSPAGRAFTTIYTLGSFLSIGFLLQSLARSLMESTWGHRAERKRMRKRIEALRSHFILCGFGRMGEAAAEEFELTAAPFVVIEHDPERCEAVLAKDFPLVRGDATREGTLVEAGIERASGVLALLDSDPDNLYVVLCARELRPDVRIMARAEHESSERRILQAGAERVISPFATAGHHIASSMLLATATGGRTPRPATADGPAPAAPAPAE